MGVRVSLLPMSEIAHPKAKAGVSVLSDFPRVMDSRLSAKQAQCEFDSHHAVWHVSSGSRALKNF